MSNVQIGRQPNGLISGRITRRRALQSVAAGIAVPVAGHALPGVAWAQDETYEVAYLAPGFNIPFWKYLSDGIKQQAAT